MTFIKSDPMPICPICGGEAIVVELKDGTKLNSWNGGVVCKTCIRKMVRNTCVSAEFYRAGRLDADSKAAYERSIEAIRTTSLDKVGQ